MNHLAVLTFPSLAITMHQSKGKRPFERLVCAGYPIMLCEAKV